MAKRRTPRPPSPARRRAAGGGSTRSTTSRGARAASTRSTRPTSGRASSSSTKSRPGASKRASSSTAKVTRPKAPPKAAKKATPAKAPRRTTKAAAKTTATGRALRASAPKSTAPRQQAGQRGPGSLREQVERDRRLREETVRTPPSSLTHSPQPSAARTGRAELKEALANHTESSPALTGGDVDADWESAYASGDEAPGGDMPTPDQGVVEEIGTALGIEYQDDEELKGAAKVEERDQHRWELDPASAEDYQERSKPDRRKR